jgi:hypothetical protein
LSVATQQRGQRNRAFFKLLSLRSMILPPGARDDEGDALAIERFRQMRARSAVGVCGSAADGRRAGRANTRGNVGRDGVSRRNAASRPCWGSSGSNYRVCGSRDPKGPSARRLPRRPPRFFWKGTQAASLGEESGKNVVGERASAGRRRFCVRRDPQAGIRSLAGTRAVGTTSAAKSITLKNVGTSSLKISNIAVSGNFLISSNLLFVCFVTI